MTMVEKLALMREIEQRNTERLQKAGLLNHNRREEQSDEQSA